MQSLKSKGQTSKDSAKPSLDIFILAGGKSSRMGRDKSRLRLGAGTVLSQIRKTAESTKLPVTTLRRDVIPPCGPLSGIYTALTKTSADAVLFLACDMPLVTPDLLQKILVCFRANRRALFTKSDSAGFPFVVPKAALEVVQEQISRKEFSIRSLARKLKAEMFRPSTSESQQLWNINTPSDWQKLKKR